MLTAKDGKENAKKFIKEYGGLFGMIGSVIDLPYPAVILNTVKNKQLIIESRPDGIYINNVFFCKEW
jgi:hypothetical protein